MPEFHHADHGVSEARWLAEIPWERQPILDVDRLASDHHHVVLIAAHPDDETLGAGALISALAARQVGVTVVVCTDGEHSHPHATAWTPELVAAQRRAEVADAVDELAPGAHLEFLGLADGGLDAEEHHLSQLLDDVLTPGTLLLAPWTNDGHPDHDAAGRAVLDAARRLGCAVLLYPIWLWHWCEPADVDLDRALVCEPQVADLERKACALSRFASQIEPLGPLPGDQPVLPAPVLARAQRIFEVFFDPADDGTHPMAQSAHRALTRIERRRERFDAMYDDGADPWGFADSFYEQRKRDLTLAILGRTHYPRVLEVGCASGQLAVALAGRADHLTGVDTSQRALDRARTLAEEADVAHRCRWLSGHAPDDLPDGSFDLIVLSEVGYFMTPTEWVATLRRAQQALTAAGELLVAHWQRPTRDIALNGSLVHQQSRHAIGLPLRAHYRDDDVCIEVWGAPRSVADLEARR